MKKRVFLNLRRAGVCALSAIIIFTTPLAVLADELTDDYAVEDGLFMDAEPSVEDGVVVDAESAVEDGVVADAEPTEENDFVEEVKAYLAEKEEAEPACVEALDLSDEVYFMGALSGTESELSLDEDTVSEINSELDTVVIQRELAADISEYEVSLEEADDLAAGFLNDNPQYFYVDDVCVEYEPETEYVTTIYFSYLKDSAEKQVAYERKVADILSDVDENWNDVEKLFYLHDYIVTHCEYDLTYTDYTAYGCLVEGSTVCQGYSLAFKDLGNRLGINTGYVSSEKLCHAWNYVELNGKNYFIDTTWDDATGYSNEIHCHWYEAYCGHTNFLKSQDEMDESHTDENGNPATDIRSTQGNIYGLYNNTEYDDTEWSLSISPVVCLSDGIIYLKQNGDICKSSGNFLTETKLNAVTGKYYVFNSTSFYRKTYGTLVGMDNAIFVNNWNEILLFDPVNNGLTSLHTLTAAEKNTGYIYGMRGDGTTLIYSLATDCYDVNKKSEGTLDVSAYVGGSVTGVTLNKNYIEFTQAGQTETLVATVKPAGYTVDSWASSDTGVATVSANGVVTAVGPGVAMITAKSGKKQAICVVSFSSTWQEDFDYELNNQSNYIEIDSYKGSAASLTIPATAVVGGKVYRTRMRGLKVKSKTETTTTYEYVGIFLNNSTLQEITFEDGVLFYTIMYMTFYNCTALKKVDMSGTDTTGVSKLSYTFRNCSKLEEINFSGCDFGNLNAATDAFYASRNIKKIYTPAEISPVSGLDFASGVTLKEITASGIGTTAYTSLKDAPANSLIANPSLYQLSAIAFDNNSFSGLIGAETVLAVTYTPADAVDIAGVVWSSSNTSVATVENGVIRITGAGTANITLSNAAGTVQAVCTVTGIKPVSPVPTLTRMSNGVKVTWTGAQGIVKYRVYRKNDTGTWNKGVVVTGTQYMDTTCELGNEYTYLLRCVSEDGSTLLSDFDSKKSATILYADPVSPIPTLTKTDNGVKVAWDAQAGITKFRIYRKTGNGSWNGGVVVSGTEYLDTTCEIGNEYTYLMRCVSADGKSLISVFDSSKARTILYADPVSPIPTLTKTDNGVKVAWDAQAGITKFRIYRKTGNGNWNGGVVVSGTEYLDTTCEIGNEYTYLMRCVSADGKSLISVFDSSKARTILYADPVSPVPTLTKTDNGVKVAWDAQAGVTKFRIYRKTGDSGWITVAVTGGTEYLDTTCEIGKEYTYLMRCVSADGKTLISLFDSKKAVSILYADPVSPKPELASGNNGVEISWTSQPGVTKYRIYRKTADSGWITVAVTGGNSYTDTTAEKGNTYIYLMRCVSSDGKSLISAFDSSKATEISY